MFIDARAIVKTLFRPHLPTFPFPAAPLLRAGTQIHTVGRKSRERRPKTNGINLEKLAMGGSELYLWIRFVIICPKN